MVYIFLHTSMLSQITLRSMFKITDILLNQIYGCCRTVHFTVKLQSFLFSFISYLTCCLFVLLVMWICTLSCGPWWCPEADRLQGKRSNTFGISAGSLSFSADTRQKQKHSHLQSLTNLPFKPTSIYHADRQVNYLHRFADTLMHLYWLLAGNPLFVYLRCILRATVHL